MARYKVYQPDHYPIAWISATKAAAEKALADDHSWVSVDWARGEAGAVSRMKRLRVFRDGLKMNPGISPEVAKLMEDNWSLHFRKVALHGVWDVQLRWQEGSVTDGLVKVIKQSLDSEGGYGS